MGWTPDPTRVKPVSGGWTPDPSRVKPVASDSEQKASGDLTPKDLPKVDLNTNKSVEAPPKVTGELQRMLDTPTEGTIDIPKGGVAAVALQVQQDNLDHSQKEYVKGAKDKIRALAIQTDFGKKDNSMPTMDEANSSTQTMAHPDEFNQGVNHLVNPENIEGNVIQLDDNDKAELSQYAGKAAQLAPTIQTLSKKVEENPDDVQSLNELADVLTYADDTQGALSLYSKANSIADNGQSLMGLGNVYLKTGQDGEAKKAFTDAYLKDGNPDALVKAAYSDARLGNHVESDKILDTLKTDFPDYSYSYALSAYNKQASGDKEGAAVDNATYQLLRGQELMPESVQADDPNSDYAKERASQQAEMNNIAAAMEAPINFFGEMEMGTIMGAKEGLSKVKKGLDYFSASPSGIARTARDISKGRNNGDGITNILDVINGAAETAFSSAMAGVPITNMAFHALPESVNKVLMQPLNIIGNLSDEEVKQLSERSQALLGAGNTLASVLLLAKLHSGKKAFTPKEEQAIYHIVNGESITGESSSLKTIVEKAKAYLEQSKIGDIQTAQKIWTQIPKDLSVEAKMAVAPDLITRDKLSAEMEKASPAFKGYYAEKIKGVDENIQSKLNISLGLKEQAAEKSKTVEAPKETIVEAKAVEPTTKAPVVEEKVLTETPTHVDELKTITPETKVTELPIGIEVSFNGEKGTIGKSETGEVILKGADGKETIIAGGGDESTLADKGITKLEGTYSDKYGDYYVNGDKVYKVKDGKLKPVYEGANANIERRDAIIRKALEGEKVKPVKAVEEIKVEAPKVEEIKVEAPKVEEIKVEAPKVEEIKVEAPKVEEIKVEAPKVEEIKVEAPKVEEVKPESKPKEETAKPIRQLGTGHDVYYESEKYRVNDSSNGKILLNVGDAKELMPLASIEFDNPNEAVFVAEKLNELAPKGLDGSYHNVDKIINNLKKEYKNRDVSQETKVENTIPKDELPLTYDKPFTEEEIRDAYEQRDKELEGLKNTKGYKEQHIHDNLGGVKPEDWARFGDSNWTRGKEGKAFKKKWFKKDALELDTAADVMSEDAGVEITPQDIVDYIMEATKNPKKFDRRYKELNDASHIPAKDVDPLLSGDAKTVVQIIESNRGMGLTDLEVETIKKFVENADKKKRTDTKAGASVPKSKEPVSRSASVGKETAKSKTSSQAESKYAELKDNISSAGDKLKKLLSMELPEGTQKMGFGIDDLIDGAVKVIHAAIDAGEKVETAIKYGIDHLKKNWQGEFPEKEVTDILSESVKKVPTFSVKNSHVDERAKELGIHEQLQEAYADGVRDFGKVWNEAEAAVKDKSVSKESLRKELAASPRPITDVESALLTQDMIDIEGKIYDTVQAINNAPSEKRANELLAEKIRLENDLYDNFLADKNAGKATARGLSARRLVADRRYNVLNMKNEWRATQKGEPLTEEQNKKIDKLHDEIQKANKRLEQFEKDLAEATKKIDSFSKIKEAVTRRKVVSLSPEKIARKKELYKELFGGKLNDVGHLVALLGDKKFYEYSKLVLEEAAGDFKEFSRKMVEEVGDAIHEHLPAIYEKLKGQVQGVEQLDNGLFKIPKQVLRDLIESGVDTIEELTDKVHAEIVKEYPDATIRQVRDSISEYGKQVSLNKGEVETKLRQAKQVGRLISSYEDVQNKIRPLKSGLERDKLTQQARNLMKNIKQLMKDIPASDAELEKKWKSTLDAAKSRVKNDIEDLDARIENAKNGIPNVKNDTKAFVGDSELEALKKERDAKKETLDKLEGDSGVSYEEKVDRVVASLEKKLADLHTRLASEDKSVRFAKRKKADPLKSERIDTLKQEIKKNSDELAQLKKDSGLVEEERNAAYRKRAEKKAEEYRARIKNRDYSKRTTNKLNLDAESLKAQTDVAKAKSDYEEALMKHELEQRGSSEKVIDWTIKMMREGMLTGIHTLGKLSSFALERQLAIRPLYNAAGKALEIIPAIKRLANASPTEGGFQAGALGENYKAFFSKKTAQESLRKFKEGKSSDDLLYGDSKGREKPMLPTRSHGAIKQFAFQSEKAYVLEAGRKWLEKQGLENDPVAKQWLENYSYVKGMDAIYMADSKGLKNYQMLLRNFEQSGGGKKALAKLARVVFPIVKVPLNFGKDVFINHNPIAFVNNLRKVFMADVQAMTPEARDAMMLALKKGAVGTAFYIYGLSNPKVFGGLYSNQKEKGDVKEGDMKIADMTVSHYYTHNAPMEVAQMGATVAQVLEHNPKKYGDALNITRALYATVQSEATKLPFVGELFTGARSALTPEGAADYAGNFVGSRIIPVLVQEIARWKDETKRDDRGFLQKIEGKIPVLRETLPVKKERKKAGSRRKRRRPINDTR